MRPSSASRIRCASGEETSYAVFQRIFDMLTALILLVFAAPIILVAAILIRMSSPGPAIYQQVRIGKDEQPFTMFKLRTMYVGSDDATQREFNCRELLGLATPADGIFKVDAPGITPVGRFLRRFSIDELPQLLNVLRGEMSIVGPRPSLPWEVALYSLEQRRRHQCRPGMTGLWQVSGRSRCPMPEMLALDLAYVESRSLLLDIRILLRTPRAVFVKLAAR